MYFCNICFESPSHPVVTFCGHLYCCPCLIQWLKARPLNKVCPVCKGVLNKFTIIQVNRRFSSNDPRLQRFPTGSNLFTNYLYSPNGQNRFGDGRRTLVFGIWALRLNHLIFGDKNNFPTDPMDFQQVPYKFMLYLGFLIIAWLVYS